MRLPYEAMESSVLGPLRVGDPLAMSRELVNRHLDRKAVSKWKMRLREVGTQTLPVLVRGPPVVDGQDDGDVIGGTCRCATPLTMISTRTDVESVLVPGLAPVTGMTFDREYSF